MSASLKSIQKYFPIALLVLGAVLRLAYLGIIPEGCEQDEAFAAWNAFSLYHDGIDSAGYGFPVYFEAWGHGQNALISYLMLPLIALLRGHISLWAIRFPQAFVAIATLGAFYFLLRELYDSRTACWGLFLLAICPWHIMMSRWGLEANLAPGFLILGFCFFVCSFRRPPLMILSAVCYGLCLYCYALTWIIVPIILVLQGLYGLRHQKIVFNKWVVLAILTLGALAFPLMCFLLVNKGYLPSFHIGPFSVYKMTSYRGGELAQSLKDILANTKNTLKLFYYQDGPYAYDVIAPYGFFYRTGRIFVVIGLVLVLFRVGKALCAKTFCPETLVLIQLIGGGVIGMLVYVDLSRINGVFIPLVMCETIGVVFVLSWLFRHRHSLGIGAAGLLLCLYLGEMTCFQIDYYTEYREESSVWFYKGADEAVKMACQLAEESHRDIYIRRGLHYPNVLLTMETGAREYLDSVEYSDYPPTPSQFSVGDVTVHMEIDWDAISDENIYIFIESDYDSFRDFQIMQFTHWYVAY